LETKQTDVLRTIPNDTRLLKASSGRLIRLDSFQVLCIHRLQYEHMMCAAVYITTIFTMMS